MTVRELLDTIRDDYRRHGSHWNERAVWALAVYRFGNWANARPTRFGRRFFSKCYGLLDTGSQIVTGVTMNRDVRLGKDFHIVHTGALFIHPQVVIGDRVGIMQNVTLGTNMGPDVPVIGDDVFIGAGACILGKVRVGNGARVAANSLVINDVPEGAFAVGVPAKNMKARPRAPHEASEAGEVPAAETVSNVSAGD
ncbi:MAG: serine acetyltransferase [Myxococcales bacterium]|nr:serine acetyltransferase [Myxococcales bacterium]